MWEKFAPTHRSRDTAHAQWLQIMVAYRELTRKSRTDRHRIFKLGGGMDHDPPCMTSVQVQKVENQGHVT